MHVTGKVLIHRSGEFVSVIKGYEGWATVRMIVPNNQLYPTELDPYTFIRVFHPCQKWINKLARVKPTTFHQWETLWKQARNPADLNWLLCAIYYDPLQWTTTKKIRETYDFRDVWIKIWDYTRENTDE